MKYMVLLTRQTNSLTTQFNNTKNDVIALERATMAIMNTIIPSNMNCKDIDPETLPITLLVFGAHEKPISEIVSDNSTLNVDIDNYTTRDDIVINVEDRLMVVDLNTAPNSSLKMSGYLTKPRPDNHTGATEHIASVASHSVNGATYSSRAQRQGVIGMVEDAGTAVSASETQGSVAVPNKLDDQAPPNIVPLATNSTTAKTNAVPVVPANASNESQGGFFDTFLHSMVGIFRPIVNFVGSKTFVSVANSSEPPTTTHISVEPTTTVATTTLSYTEDTLIHLSTTTAAPVTSNRIKSFFYAFSSIFG